MKRMKKIASMLLAVIMVLGMTMTAFASETTEPTQKDHGEFDITLTGVAKPNHVFGAYQIFKGDLLETKDENGKVTSTTLSNIEWGSSVDQTKLTELLAELKDKTVGEGTKESKPFSSLIPADVAATESSPAQKQSSAADVAELLSGNGNEFDTAKAIAFADVMGSTVATQTEDGTSDVLKYLTTSVKDSDKGTEQTDKTYTYKIEDLVAGYYLVQDKSESLEEGDAYTRNILQVVSETIVKVKSETPTIEKKIVTGSKPTDRADANNAGIGNVVSYEITGTVPNMTGYDYYFYVINDTLSSGLTFNNDIVVTVDGTQVYPKPENSPTNWKDTISVYTGTAADGKTFKVAFNDILKDFADKEGKSIVVNYSATVNSSAEIGNTGNPNTVTLQYSNNPNHNYNGDRNSSTPGIPDSTKPDSLGETPDDKTITYVAEINITKTFSDIVEGVRPGATFTLTGTSTQTVLRGGIYFEEDPNGTWYLKTDGTYTNVAPIVIPYMELSASTTAGYVELSTEEAASYEGHDTVRAKASNAEGAEVKLYRPYNATTDSSKTIYRLVVANVMDYVTTSVRYKQVDNSGENAQLDPIKTYVNMVGTTDEDGNLIFTGLGAGIYTLEETGVPEGYNKAETITIDIKCEVPTEVTNGNEKAKWTLGEETVGVVGLNSKVENENYTESGKYETTIHNQKGSLLPSTGGIGTTIFYVVGGILVIGAGILLVAKKRMGNR